MERPWEARCVWWQVCVSNGRRCGGKAGVGIGKSGEREWRGRG
jgi:hypothetical protein